MHMKVIFSSFPVERKYLSLSRHYPGKNFTGRIVFIDPVLDPITRVAKVRVETGNESGKLKPEMFATGIVLPLFKNIVIMW